MKKREFAKTRTRRIGVFQSEHSHIRLLGHLKNTKSQTFSPLYEDTKSAKTSKMV